MRHREPSVKLPIGTEIGQPGRAEADLAPGSQERAPDPHPEVGRREEALAAQECLFRLWQCLPFKGFWNKIPPLSHRLAANIPLLRSTCQLISQNPEEGIIFSLHGKT